MQARGSKEIPPSWVKRRKSGCEHQRLEGEESCGVSVAALGVMVTPRVPGPAPYGCRADSGTSRASPMGRCSVLQVHLREAG